MKLRYMMVGLGVLLALAACGQSEDDILLPTLISAATFTPSATLPPTTTPTPDTRPQETQAALETHTAQTQAALATQGIQTEVAAATQTEAARPTATPTASATASPTQTPTPSPTQTPDPTLAALNGRLGAVVSAQALNIRNGPGEEYDVIAHLDQGAVVAVEGASNDRVWLIVEYEQGLVGWIYTGFVELTGDVNSVPIAEPTPLPELVRLEGLTWIAQQFNNCAPTALTIALTYYGGDTDVTPARDWLRPENRRDVSVDIAQMVDYVNEEVLGLRAVWRMGGDWTTIRRLVAAGFPVIIETSVQVTSPEPGWAGHNRVIIGYDGDTILTYDSYLGHGNYKGYRVAQDTLDEVWRHMNRNYMVIYEPERESELAYIMGENWIIENSIQRAHRVALAEMAANPENAFAQFNLGTTFDALGMYEEAAAAYDASFRIGLPFRIFWYQFGVFDAYYHSGRYNEVIDHARRALLNMGGNGAEELYYWLGMGYAGRGQLDQAREQFQNALAFNPRFSPAQTALDAIISGTYKPPT